ncbi:leucine-zipper-like transcriptional regulator 1 homolog, partial [Aplysia californica]|uniref:Leucine-zipper-like transcriptional regulator 1 homolog n=1 Tax=Aplysia californica TaxID=6500 RepID=A0ABM0K9S5_APLCA
MAPRPLLCACFRWCRECGGRGRRRKSRRLIPSSRRKGGGGGGAGGGGGGVGGGCTSREEEDDDDYSDEEEGQEEEEEDTDSVVARYSAFDSPLFRRPGIDLDALDSSLERVDGGERRGSLPLVSTFTDSMDSVSTTSRLANFFSKKGFKTNLKRTKSATKLDRKRSSPNLAENNDTSSLMGSLKRTMSLGRLTRKKHGKGGAKGGGDPYGTPPSGRSPAFLSPDPASSTSSSRLPTPHASPA